jgi:hypothetical protein
VVLEAVEQGELVEEDGAEGEASGTGETACWDRAMGVEDALELAVEVLDGERAERVKHPADLDAIVGVWVGTPAGSDQEAVGAETVVANGRVTDGRPPCDLPVALTGGLGISSITSTSATNRDNCGTMRLPTWFGLTAPW